MRHRTARSAKKKRKYRIDFARCTGPIIGIRALCSAHPRVCSASGFLVPCSAGKVDRLIRYELTMSAGVLDLQQYLEFSFRGTDLVINPPDCSCKKDIEVGRILLALPCDCSADKRAPKITRAVDLASGGFIFNPCCVGSTGSHNSAVRVELIHVNRQVEVVIS